MAISALVCTDEPVLAAGLAACLPGDSGIEIVDVCTSTLQLVERVAQQQPDLVVLHATSDVTIRLLDETRRAGPNSKIILWVRELTLSLAAQAVNVGVAGILRRTMSASLTAKCLERVAAGENWFEKDLILSLLSAKTVSLTKRERQLVRLLSQGLSNKEIASILDIKEGTVKVYLSRLYRKAGVKDRLELALHGFRNLGLGSFGASHSEIGVAQRADLFDLPELDSLVLTRDSSFQSGG